MHRNLTSAKCASSPSVSVWGLIVCLIGGAIGTVVGCGTTVLTTQEPSNNDSTLPSTIIDEPDGSDEPSEPVGPVDVGGEESGVEVYAHSVFCCDPLTVQFGVDVDGDDKSPVKLEWFFGDGSMATIPAPEHTYVRVDQYQAVVDILWNDGTSSSHGLLLTFAETGGAIVLSTQGENQNQDDQPAGGTIIADAGPDQSAEEGEAVALDGENSRGDNLTYVWQQTEGQTVALRGAEQSQASFIMPTLDKNERLVFELTVSSGDQVSSDQVRIFPIQRDGATDDPVGPAEDPTVNHAPVAINAEYTTNSGEAIVILFDAEDLDEDPLEFEVRDEPAHGTLSNLTVFAGSFATATYTPEDEYVGSDSVVFRAYDGELYSGDEAISIQITEREVDNVIPTALDKAFRTFGETSKVVLLEGSDADDQPLEFVIKQQPTNGTVQFIEQVDATRARFRYTPNRGFKGEDSFTYVTSDSHEESLPSTVSVRVSPKIIPWLECNAPTAEVLEVHPNAIGVEPGTTFAEHTLAGLEHYAAVTDTVIVTTMYYNWQHIYPYLMENKPEGMRIIGGFKPAPALIGCTRYATGPYNFTYMGSVEERAGWNYLYSRAEEIVAATGEPIIVMENEGTLWRYHAQNNCDEECTIDLAELEVVLEGFNSRGIEVWSSLPTLLGETGTEMYSRSLPFVTTWYNTIDAGAKIGNGVAWYFWENSDWVVENRAHTWQLVGDIPLFDQFFVTQDGYIHYTNFDKRCYTPLESIQQMNEFDSQSVFVVYPGTINWLPVGEEYEQIAFEGIDY